MAKASGFVGLGTWEFLVKGGKWWFMEVNARVQVGGLLWTRCVRDLVSHARQFG